MPRLILLLVIALTACNPPSDPSQDQARRAQEATVVPPDPSRDQARRAQEATVTLAKQLAEQAARQWLKLMDAGHYAATHDNADALFKKAITRDAWVERLRWVRKPLGERKSLSLLSAEYTTEVPGAVDGHYVVMQFSSSFENKAKAAETLTVVRESDRVWRITGYFIK